MTDEVNRYFNPDNKTHQNLVAATEAVLKEESPLDTRNLAEQIEEETGVVKKSTARSLLYYARNYIVENTGVEAEKKPGNKGEAAWEWRLVE